ncbi:hypothetical protein [Streptomyces stelliscabiei]|uniref:Uncharacterized protein n=1 Tax=Streptomyces stelliscabiei TaxID=146820 RepID=A0A8I0TWG5_9ACTN|nr:hypothetical protein [Streptomyces stelliscabiei]MBE1602962.1 hypothetical protein [Streptomyces stelliscabiei]MDX2521710.1 hypothetical protein [Streptomyces stelliscabiei]SOD65246.1 hypothetical protein SAMN06272781_0069 [Streptomyces sp. 1222.2]
MSLMDLLDSACTAQEAPVTAEDVLARARALAPRLRERSEERCHVVGWVEV